MTDARKALEQFVEDYQATRISDDLPALDSTPANSDEVTDRYLAALASKHGLRFATFDANIKYGAVELIP